jgi:hypothetical protein
MSSVQGWEPTSESVRLATRNLTRRARLG